MQAIENIKKFSKNLKAGHFPTGHIGAVTVLMLVLCGFTLNSGAGSKSTNTRLIKEIAVPTFESALEELASTEPAASPKQSNQHTKTVTVKSGDNLSVIFKRAGLNDRDMIHLLNNNKESSRLKSLYPSHKIEFTLEENQLVQLTYTKDKLNSFSFIKNGDKFEFKEDERTADVRIANGSGFITQSLYTAGIEARLDDKLIMELAEIFGWDIDFALDIRKGDHFKVVYEELFLDGEKIGNGAIVAAEFVNQNEVFQAIRYTNTRGETGYYSPEGQSMRKEFLRAPVDFRRISSNFNPRRLHPVTKTVRPHRGIDYAAATGTPVWSSGNGRVIKAGYSRANGNYVFIQHGNSIQTKYLHLHKRYVKTGQKVKQKQKIGTVGSTGLATGPHLHYEFLINGVHRNPRTIVSRLPKARSVGSGELARFVVQTRDQIAMLNESANATQYAEADSLDATKNL